MKSCRATWLGRMAAVACGLLLAAPARAGSVIGPNMTTSSQVNGGAIESRTDSMVDPGVEILFGDGNDFSWMVAGDAIDFSLSSNPVAPYRLDVFFGATHTFLPSDVVTLAFSLPDGFAYGPAAIVLADNVGRVNGTKVGNVLSFDFHDLWTVSLDDFGGQLGVVFAVPEPGTLSLVVLGGLGLLRKVRAG